jgi:hypothetical protein
MAGNIPPVDGTANVVTSLKDWAKKPFSSQMDLAHWALFTGLVVVLVIMWLMVLRDLKGEI